MALNPSEVYQSMTEYFFSHSFYPIKLDLRRAIQRRLKGIKAAASRFENELLQNHQWSKKEKEGQLLQAHFGQLKRGMKSIELTDWETSQPLVIQLDPTQTPQDEVSSRFKLAKKMRKSIPHLQFMIQKNRVYLRKLELLSSKIPFAESEDELENLREEGAIPKKQEFPSKKAALEKPKPYFEFRSEARILIWVGKSAKENDLLTFQHANGLDTWLHASDCPGSHVVIKAENPDQETLKDAMELALCYSKAKDWDEGEVVITLKKHVSRFGKKQPGKVQLARQKTAKIKRDPARLKRLKDSRI